MDGSMGSLFAYKLKGALGHVKFKETAKSCCFVVPILQEEPATGQDSEPIANRRGTDILDGWREGWLLMVQ